MNSPTSGSQQSELVEQIRGLMADDKAHPILPVGSGTKNALAATQAADVERIDMRGHAGIVSYDPSEFLLSARSGTRVEELVSVLAEHGQYLPFDPLFVRDGATIGGTVASGLSGPNRLLYGGVRDFIMEVEMFDGLGRLVRGGGKVVKNAAGFDTPKLMVGSYGRLGILTEVTLKVIPTPATTATLRLHCESTGECVRATQAILAKPLPTTAIDFDASHQLLARFAGPSGSLEEVIERASQLVQPPRELYSSGAEETAIWANQAGRIEKPLVEGEYLVRIASSLDAVVDLLQGLETLSGLSAPIVSCAGAVTWVHVDSSDALSQLNAALEAMSVSGVVIRGIVANLQPVGTRTWCDLAKRIQQAIDPKQRFIAYPTEARRQKDLTK